ncbi:carboxypeptidase-like regulatory domain-containing protein [Thalassoroseus pseudoceratinae]|uniref:carboxypeptidase-like regulatory domain-containing protein n=1 Tax=Thalassoroseus pseudoceratinae TaxID=2713176 RepID=UPI001423FB5C|nr:carboxypeptidase-like regulatory domain-containing protein [Thalassoroseus pseudoceratinae]
MAPVKGTITLSGAPLTTGIVLLESAESGFSAYASLDADGKFLIKNVPIGDYGVAVSPPEPPAPGTTAAPRDEASSFSLFVVPSKYQSISTSGFTAVVSRDSPNVLTFNLE